MRRDIVKLMSPVVSLIMAVLFGGISTFLLKNMHVGLILYGGTLSISLLCFVFYLISAKRAISFLFVDNENKSVFELYLKGGTVLEVDGLQLIKDPLLVDCINSTGRYTIKISDISEIYLVSHGRRRKTSLKKLFPNERNG